LLRQVRSWSLPPGASASPGLTFVGLLLLALSECALLAWGWAVCHDVMVWGLPWWRTALVMVLVTVGSWHVWRLWVALRRPGVPLTLSWLGPLPKPEAKPAGLPSVSVATPVDSTHRGWQVLEWAQPAEVRLVMDTQCWMLMQVCSLPGASPVRCHWSWVPGRGAEPVHRLRALLALPSSMTCHAAQGPMSGDAPQGSGKRSMASWLGRARFGAAASAQNMNTKPSRRTGVDRRGGHPERDLGDKAASSLEADFPLTEILPERRPS